MFFLIFCVLCIPIVQLIGGWCMRYHTPKKINSWIGYRTTNAMKNADTWKLANQYCGKLWLMIGTVSLILSAIIGFSCLFFSKKIAGNGRKAGGLFPWGADWRPEHKSIHFA